MGIQNPTRTPIFPAARVFDGSGGRRLQQTLAGGLRFSVSQPQNPGPVGGDWAEIRRGGLVLGEEASGGHLKGSWGIQKHEKFDGIVGTGQTTNRCGLEKYG